MSQRTVLMIPGPIELEPDVLLAMAERQRSHVDPDFIRTFGSAVDRLREVFLAPTAQPFVVAGSGTLAMEMAVANLAQPGARAVVVNTGWFSDRMGLILERYGAQVTHVRAGEIGGVPDLAEVERAIAAGADLVTLTHVDTSTGVRAPVEAITKLARERGALTIVDGVCAAGAEVMLMDDWGVDVALTASQKALGAPPGIAVVMAGPKALRAWRERKTRVPSLYLDWGEWLPIHEAYEAERPAYFATPPVNLITALDVSLGHLVAEGMDARFKRHERMARAFRAAWAALGLEALPRDPKTAANTLSALYFPPGVDATLVGKVRAQGAIVAGGLHPDLKTKYFRVGHMGAVQEGDVLATVGAIERALAAAGLASAGGEATLAAQRSLMGA